MSDNYTKHAIRIMLDEILKNKSTTEILKWLQQRFGKCKWINWANDEVESFDYQDFTDMPFQPYETKIVKDDNNNYAIDIIIDYAPDYECGSLNLSLRELMNTAITYIVAYNLFEDRYNSHQIYDHIKIVSYTWYTGSDEPYIYGLEK